MTQTKEFPISAGARQIIRHALADTGKGVLTKDADALLRSGKMDSMYPELEPLARAVDRASFQASIETLMDVLKLLETIANSAPTFGSKKGFTPAQSTAMAAALLTTRDYLVERMNPQLDARGMGRIVTT